MEKPVIGYYGLSGKEDVIGYYNVETKVFRASKNYIKHGMYQRKTCCRVLNCAIVMSEEAIKHDSTINTYLSLATDIADKSQIIFKIN